MRRKLLIIGVPLPSENSESHEANLRAWNDERIVTMDCNSYKNFFASGEAGCWDECEIILLKKEDATVENIYREVAGMNNYEYTITIFIGHGVVQNEIQKLGAWSGASFDAEKLINNSKRQILIIDACSSRVGQTLNPDRLLADSNYRERPQGTELSRESSKSIYNENIQKCATDNLPCILFAASVGEVAYCEENYSLFSSVLRRMVVKWLLSSNGSVLSVDELFNEIDSYFKNNYPQQHPRIENKNNLTFAINPFVD